MFADGSGAVAFPGGPIVECNEVDDAGNRVLSVQHRIKGFRAGDKDV